MGEIPADLNQTRTAPAAKHNQTGSFSKVHGCAENIPLDTLTQNAVIQETAPCAKAGSPGWSCERTPSSSCLSFPWLHKKKLAVRGLPLQGNEFHQE